MSVAASAYARSSLSCATLATFVPGREPQLIARDVRPGDRADHLRLHAEVPERLDQAARRCAPARRCRDGSARRSSASAACAASGSSQTKSGSSVTAVAQRPCGVSVGIIVGVGVRDARDRSSCSASVASVAAPARVGIARSSCAAPRPRPAALPRHASWLGARPVARGRLDVRRPHDQLARRAAGSGGSAGGDAARPLARVPRLRPHRRRRGSPRARPRAQRTIAGRVARSPLPVARSTLASEAPVSSDHADEQQERRRGCPRRRSARAGG